jgi:hypothetical protein
VPVDEVTEHMLTSALKHGLKRGNINDVEGVPALNIRAPEALMTQLSPILRDETPVEQGPGNTFLHFHAEAVESISAMLRQLAQATATINGKYAGVSSHLGSPLTERADFGADNGFVRSYEHGAIYIDPHGRVHEVHGDIYTRYVSLGAEAGLLGYPQTDEQATVLGTGQFNHFSKGSIYWTAGTGAWEIHGALRDRWWQLDGDRSWLGYPVSNEENWLDENRQPFGRISHFQNGILGIRWQDSQIQEFPDSIVIKQSVNNSLVNSSLDFGLNSKGDWYYSGHFHNDGFAGCVATIVTFSKFVDGTGKSFAMTAERSLGGTLDAEERNDDWTDKGSGDPFIRENWAAIRIAGFSTRLESDTTVGDILGVAIPLGVAVAFLIGGATSKVCGPYGSVKRDPYTHQDQPSVGFELIPPDQDCPKDIHQN